jgi:hypothetical protein
MINGITGLPPNLEQRVPALPEPTPVPEEFSEPIAPVQPLLSGMRSIVTPRPR